MVLALKQELLFPSQPIHCNLCNRYLLYNLLHLLSLLQHFLFLYHLYGYLYRNFHTPRHTLHTLPSRDRLLLHLHVYLPLHEHHNCILSSVSLHLTCNCLRTHVQLVLPLYLLSGFLLFLFHLHIIFRTCCIHSIQYFQPLCELVILLPPSSSGEYEKVVVLLHLSLSVLHIPCSKYLLYNLLCLLLPSVHFLLLFLPHGCLYHNFHIPHHTLHTLPFHNRLQFHLHVHFPLHEHHNYILSSVHRYQIYMRLQTHVQFPLLLSFLSGFLLFLIHLHITFRTCCIHSIQYFHLLCESVVLLLSSSTDEYAAAFQSLLSLHSYKQSKPAPLYLFPLLLHP